MTFQGTLIIDVLALGLAFLVFHLVRRRVLSVGWGLIWALPLAGLLVFLNVPPLLGWVTGAVGALYPVSALSLIGFVFLFFAVILLSVQVTRLRARQIQLIQQIGLREALAPDEPRSGPSPSEPRDERLRG